MDALMHYRQFCRNFIYSRPRKLRKIYSTSPWLIWIFRGGGVIATALWRYAESTKILFALNFHETRQRKKPSIVNYDTSN